MPIAKPINFWDGRPPKTRILDTGSTEEGPAVIDYVDRQNLFPDLKPGTQVKLINDETIDKYTLWQAKSVTDKVYGLIFKSVPKATYVFANPTDADHPGRDSSITAGVADDAVIPLQRGTEEGDSFFEFKSISDAITVVNPIWLSQITAGKGLTDAQTSMATDKIAPVVCKGYIEKVKVPDPQDSTKTILKDAFFLEWVTRPVTIIKGTTTSAINGGLINCNNLKVLWGIDPKRTQIDEIVNPDSWDSDDKAYCLFMQLDNGSYQAIDLACKNQDEIT